MASPPAMKAAIILLRLLLLVTLLLVPSIPGALPPGFQDKLFCASGHCRRPNRRVVDIGMSGPQAMFAECLDLTTGEISPVRPWGSKTGERLDTVLADGYHEDECGADQQQPPQTRNRAEEL